MVSSFRFATYHPLFARFTSPSTTSTRNSEVGPRRPPAWLFPNSLAGLEGLEPSTSGLTGRRNLPTELQTNRARTIALLSVRMQSLDSAVRFELTCACAIPVATERLRPLGYAEIEMAGSAGFEPCGPLRVDDLANRWVKPLPQLPLVPARGIGPHPLGFQASVRTSYT